MKDTGKISDKGKGIEIFSAKAEDFLKVQSQENLKLDPQHDILKGGSGKGETSKKRKTTNQQGETSRPQFTGSREFAHDANSRFCPYLEVGQQPRQEEVGQQPRQEEVYEFFRHVGNIQRALQNPSVRQYHESLKDPKSSK